MLGTHDDQSRASDPKTGTRQTTGQSDIYLAPLKTQQIQICFILLNAIPVSLLFVTKIPRHKSLICASKVSPNFG